jgi:hypothetical protein
MVTWGVVGRYSDRGQENPPFPICALVSFLKVNDGLTTDGFSLPFPVSMIRALNKDLS